MHVPQQPIPGAAPGVVPGPGENTSGMGRASWIPPQVSGWNWGAFLLNLFWGIGNNTWIALLMLVPVVNWVMPFVLGAKGNAWAWQNKRWRDIAHFRRVQRRWALAGLLIWAVSIAASLGLPWGVFHMVTHHPVPELAFTAVRTSPEATALLGTPIERAGGSQGFASREAEGLYEARFLIKGPRGSAMVQARGRETPKGWELEQVVVVPEGGGEPLLVFPRQRL